ncbi:MAG: hypothetical protein COW03_05165 [Cytophagales bacterium CG12_big_fil_rev_8_21_14_0_65_40_12]|nr:MAG: hypothetical protein COW03_05165 [Cytophagales bacterium CG12_big_fil_rev_8_21_14_0_65_40_12]PIW05126.1 MAG: hypothetical protein COW40_06550 [Cytophagales bacterium CG17_big_fil_post_rev_8_21_14_2_50_40_13]
MIWLDTWESIEAAPIDEWRKPEFGHDVLIKYCPLAELIKNLDPKSTKKSHFLQRKIYPDGFSKEKINRILKFIENDTPLLPPRITLDGKLVKIEDGNHRMHCASYYDVAYIPIIVSTDEYIKNPHPFIIRAFLENCNF